MKAEDLYFTNLKKKISPSACKTVLEKNNFSKLKNWQNFIFQFFVIFSHLEVDLATSRHQI